MAEVALSRRVARCGRLGVHILAQPIFLDADAPIVRARVGDALADTSAPTAEIRRRLKAIKGVGDYAAASMLMLLGRYDEIPMDTVFRDFVSRRYFEGGPVNSKEAAEIYADWGRWKALAYWFEMLESE